MAETRYIICFYISRFAGQKKCAGVAALIAAQWIYQRPTCKYLKFGNPKLGFLPGFWFDHNI